MAALRRRGWQASRGADVRKQDERKAGLLHNVVLQCAAGDRYRAGIRDRARRGCSPAGLSPLVDGRARAGLPDARKITSLAFAVGGRADLQVEVSLRFPFNAPGYLIEAVAADSGIAFDVVRCPIANYFRGQGAVDLCSASWCNLDYALAELTHEKLVRTKTLVSGDDRCDFRLS